MIHPHVKAAHNRGRLQRRPGPIPKETIEYVVWYGGFQPISVKTDADFLRDFAYSDLGIINEAVWCALQYEQQEYHPLDRYVPLIVEHVLNGLSELEETTIGR